jgi:hypothetical protein
MMSNKQTTGESTMKKLITVKSNFDNFDISMNTEKLDELPTSKSDDVLERLQRYIVAYQRLRSAREMIEIAEQEMEVIESESTGSYLLMTSLSDP